jgi:hypothetical protein
MLPVSSTSKDKYTGIFLTEQAFGCKEDSQLELFA